MKTTWLTTKILGLALCLSTLPVATLVTGCAGDRYHRSTGEEIDDRGTTARVKSALSNDTEYKFPGVNVDTFKGTVLSITAAKRAGPTNWPKMWQA